MNHLPSFSKCTICIVLQFAENGFDDSINCMKKKGMYTVLAREEIKAMLYNDSSKCVGT